MCAFRTERESRATHRNGAPRAPHEVTMAPKDFRSFLAAIEASGDLVKIDDPVDWDQELSGMGRLSCERYGPAFLFNNIKDYPGSRVVANPVADWRRYAVGLGLPADTPVRRLYQIYD